MPKLSVGNLTVVQTVQRTANVIFTQNEQPQVETFYIVTDNNEKIKTDTDAYIIYGV